MNGQEAEAVFGALDLKSAGSDTASELSIPGPAGLAAMPNYTLFVADEESHRVLRFSSPAQNYGSYASGVFGQTNLSSHLPNAGVGSQPNNVGFTDPVAVAVTSQGALFVVDRGANRILRFDSAAVWSNGHAASAVLGQQDFTSSVGGTTAAAFQDPTGAAVDRSGNLYVADFGNNRVLRFNGATTSANGPSAIAVFGQSGFFTSVPGTGPSQLNGPLSVAVDEIGILYVGDSGNHRVLVFINPSSKSNGAPADIVFGQPDFFASDAPTEPNASAIGIPVALTADGAGTLYVADGQFHRVLVFPEASLAANGSAATTILGKSFFSDGSTGVPTASNIGQPSGIAVMSIPGKLFVADSAFRRVLQFQSRRSLLPW